MAVYMKPTNYEKLFHNTSGEKFIINDMNPFDPDTRAIIDAAIIKHYGKDNFCVIPSCNCGYLKAASKIGQVCPKCNTQVKNSLEDGYNFLVWVKQPIGLEKLISPDLISILDKRYQLNKPTFSVIRYLLTTTYKLDRSKHRTNVANFDRLVTLLEAHGIQRGYNNFVNNMVEICRVLETSLAKTKTKNNSSEEFLNFLEENKHKFLTTHLPFPNRVLFATEENELGKFTQLGTTVPAIDFVRVLSGIDLQTRSLINKQNRVGKALCDFADFYFEYGKSHLFKKQGLIRQQVVSGRQHFTARAVVVGIAGCHQLDEVYIGWSVGIGLFRHHLIGKLFRRGYSYYDADELLRYSSRLYNPVVRELFDELIAESNGGIDVFIGRNPSLHRGSLLHMRITKIKSNPQDTTLEASPLAFKPLNCDLDGDELSIVLPVSEIIRSGMENHDFAHNVLSLHGVKSFSNALNLPKTIIANLSAWYKDGE